VVRRARDGFLVAVDDDFQLFRTAGKTIPGRKSNVVRKMETACRLTVVFFSNHALRGKAEVRQIRCDIAGKVTPLTEFFPGAAMVLHRLLMVDRDSAPRRARRWGVRHRDKGVMETWFRLAERPDEAGAVPESGGGQGNAGTRPNESASESVRHERSFILLRFSNGWHAPCHWLARGFI
jgi:hypothetical protein